MLYRSIQLKDAIERFQRRHVVSDTDRNTSTYSATDDKITPEDWENVKRYLKLLRHFVEATSHLEGNAD